jgi:hypothetical protein
MLDNQGVVVPEEARATAVEMWIGREIQVFGQLCFEELAEGLVLEPSDVRDDVKPVEDAPQVGVDHEAGVVPGIDQQRIRRFGPDMGQL